MVWSRIGDVRRYVEPFAGSLAVLLGRPAEHLLGGIRHEIANDLDGVIANFWRASSRDLDGVAEAADYPLHELHVRAISADLASARAGLAERLAADSAYCDVRLAGAYAYAVGASIMGIPGAGVAIAKPHGVLAASRADRRELILALRGRLDRVRVACGDWRRVLSRAVLYASAGDVGVFLDPPYGEGGIEYAAGGNRGGIAADVWAWAQRAHAEAPAGRRLAICVATHDDGREIPAGWSVHRWHRAGGVGQGRRPELLIFSPGCLPQVKPQGSVDA